MNYKDILYLLYQCQLAHPSLKGWGFGTQFEVGDLQRTYPLLFAETDMQFIWNLANTGRAQYLETSKFAILVVDRISESTSTSNVPMPSIKSQMTANIAACQQIARDITQMLDAFLEQWNGKVVSANTIPLPDLNGQFTDVTFGVRVEFEILTLVKTDPCRLPNEITLATLGCGQLS